MASGNRLSFVWAEKQGGACEAWCVLPGAPFLPLEQSFAIIYARAVKALSAYSR